MKQAKKTSVSLFYKVFFTVLALAFVALGIGLIVLRSYLADYEASLPKTTADAFFAAYFAPYDGAALTDYLAGDILTPFEDKDLLREELDARFAYQAFSYHNVSTGLDTDAVKYMIKAPDITAAPLDREEPPLRKVGLMTLVKSGETSRKGFPLYRVDDLTLYDLGQTNVTVNAPAGYTVCLNGIAVPDTYRAAEPIKTDSCYHMPDGVTGLLYDTYTVTGLLRGPVVTVTSEDGTDVPVTYDEAKACYTAAVHYDKALEEAYRDYVTDAAKAYATYMQNDCSFAKVSPYFEAGTDLYQAIRTSATTWVIDHDSYRFEDVEASEFYRYDDHTFSCRVTLVHVLKRSRLQDFRDKMDVTFYLREVDGTYRIYDRTNQ